MNKLFYLLVVATLFIFMFSTVAMAQSTQICGEDFESVTPGAIPEDDPTGSGEITKVRGPFYWYGEWGCYLGGGTGACDSQGDPADGEFLADGGPNGAGDACARAYVQGPNTSFTSCGPSKSLTIPNWVFDNTIGGSRTLYVKFDLRVNEDLGTSNATREFGSFKLIRFTENDISYPYQTDSIPTIQHEPSSDSFNIYHMTTHFTATYYFTRATTKTTSHLMDNEWHTIEIFIDVGTAVVEDQYDDSADGIVRIWEDDILILEDESVPFRTVDPDDGYDDITVINSMEFLRHTNTQGAPVSPLSGYIYYDNLEVWDGMPDAEAPEVPENVDVDPVFFFWFNF